MSNQDKKLDQFIKDGIKEIDNEVQEDGDIREQSEYIARMLALNPVVKVPINNKVYILHMRQVLDSKNRAIILLAITDEFMAELHGKNYSPALISAERNDNFTLEENCQTVVSAFIAKALGKFKIETLEDDDGIVKIAREKDIE